MTIPAFPLAWPAGWQRTLPGWRAVASFNRARRAGVSSSRPLTITEGLERVLVELERMGVRSEDVVLSTNLQPRLDGRPRAGQGEPDDPGVAVYWNEHGHPTTRVMAIDRYARVADNLAAVAATLVAMRAIERHGGAQILERAFSGFVALPAPGAARPWWEVLGVPENASPADILAARRALASKHHPDRGGDPARMAEINAAVLQSTAARPA